MVLVATDPEQQLIEQMVARHPQIQTMPNSHLAGEAHSGYLREPDLRAKSSARFLGVSFDGAAVKSGIGSIFFRPRYPTISEILLQIV